MKVQFIQGLAARSFEYVFKQMTHLLNTKYNGSFRPHVVHTSYTAEKTDQIIVSWHAAIASFTLEA